jgi:hypothetical protein
MCTYEPFRGAAERYRRESPFKKNVCPMKPNESAKEHPVSFVEIKSRESA